MSKPGTLIERYFDQLRDAVERYTDDPNFATEGAVATACAAIAGEEWAQKQLDENAAWTPLLDEETLHIFGCDLAGDHPGPCHIPTGALTHGDGPQTVDSNHLKSVPPDRKGSQ